MELAWPAECRSMVRLPAVGSLSSASRTQKDTEKSFCCSMAPRTRIS